MSDTAAPALGRIPQLDGLRAIAVLLVVVLHCYVRVPNTPGGAGFEFLQHALSLAYCGVDLFFVLSGFLIGGILLDQREAVNLLPVFYRRRFCRILPVYGLLLASYYVGRSTPGLNTLNFSTYFESPVPLWSYWTFTQNVAMAWTRDLGSYWLAPTWSLGIEEQFYLTMPFLIRLLDSRRLAWFCAAVVVASPALRHFAWQGGTNSLAAIFLTPVRADSLLLGVLCALGLRQPRAAALLAARRGWILAATLGLGAWVGVLSWQQQGADSRAMIIWGYSIVGLFFAGCLLLALLYPAAPPVRWLRWRPLTRLGLISYFIYLAHQPVWYVTHWLIRGRPPSHVTFTGCAVTLLAMGLTVLLGELSWRFLEAPLLAIGRRTDYRSS